jgi:hypothetical protein
MSKAQLNLFGGQDDLFPSEPTVYRADPEVVRAKLLRLLAEAKAAESLPWDRKTTRYWQTVFPQMANWLPDEEADQLRLEFRSEMARLDTAA